MYNHMREFYMNNFKISDFSAIDEFGNPVERTKREYPYSYSGFVQERCHPNEKANNTIYTDRLMSQIGYEKYKELQRKFFNSTNGNFSFYSASDIEKFLREALNKKDLIVVLVMEYCNLSNGYPLWRIDYAV